MATSPVFNWICTELEARTPLNQLEARGTVRIALKGAGLDASDVDSSQMCVVIARLLPAELAQRSVPEGDQLCEELARILSEKSFEETQAKTPDAVFRRMGG
jgi:hypothetical protein